MVVGKARPTIRHREPAGRREQLSHRGRCPSGSRWPYAPQRLNASAANAVNATLYNNLNFDFIRDIAPVARTQGAMVVNLSVPVKTVPEFIACAKANPGKINMATSGTGSAPEVWGELFKAMAGVDLVAVPYRGTAPALTELMGGQVHVMFNLVASSLEYIRAGKLRVLAVTTAVRSAALPDIPTVGEFVPGYEASGWQGIGAPRNTPAEIMEKLNKEINAALIDPKIQARIADLGAVAMPMTSAEFGKFIADDTKKWAKVIRAASIKAE
jgi:tripartite-type tricarboxylate transporter receptor subunit TctC